jgi:hypothetical protein
VIRAAFSKKMVCLITGRASFWAICGLAGALFVAATASTLRGSGQDPQSPGIEEQDDTTTSLALSAQPIAFSHRHHVTEVGLDCQLCHVYARRSPVAGIPSVETCVGCHAQVLSERPEIQKLLAFWENKEPIPWVRVHDLPDYARFSHKRHIRGGLACAECHGDVAQMEIALQVESLSMGWCVTCHKEREVSIDCLTCHY